MVPNKSLQMAYMIPNDQKAKPEFEQALTAIARIVQRHYLIQVGKTVEFSNQLVLKFYVDKPLEELMQWSVVHGFFIDGWKYQYEELQNIIFAVIEGGNESSGGSSGLAVMRSFWDEAYNTFISKPQQLSSMLHAWSHEFGHALGLQHTVDTLEDLKSEGVCTPDPSDLPSLVMQFNGDLGAVYNYPFLDVELSLLMDPTYHQDVLTLKDTIIPRPHPSEILKENTTAAYPRGFVETTTMVEYGLNGKREGYFIDNGDGTWTEYHESAGRTFHFSEQTRDVNAVYLFDKNRSFPLSLDLASQTVRCNKNYSTHLYEIFWAK